MSAGNFDFDKTLVTFDVPRIQSDGPVRIVDSLIGFLEVLRINERELLIRGVILGICLDCVFQHVNRLWKIVLLYQQSGHARRKLRLAGIYIQHFAIRLQRAIHLAIFFERHSLDEMR